MTLPTSLPETTFTRPRLRTKTSSSLAGMFDSTSSFDDEVSSSSIKLPTEEQSSLREMALNLRRAKRKLLLKSVEQPDTPMDSLRTKLLQLSLDTENSNSWNSFRSTTSSTRSLSRFED